MSIFSIFSRDKVYENWLSLVSESTGEKTKKDWKYVIDTFYVPDAINLRKVKANFGILKYRSRDAYKSHSMSLNEADFSKFGTPSIDELARVADKALGYSDWFIAGYPDVIFWFQDIEKEIAFEILGDPEKVELFDEEDKVKAEYLRKIVDAYKKEGNVLESRGE